MSSRNEEKVDGKNMVGGVAGENKGSISKCTNAGNINNSQKVLKAMDGESSISISVPDATTGLASDERANETGGIAGYFEPYRDTVYDTDMSQELSDQMDELSDLVEQLGDLGEQTGDHVSDNMDVLKDNLKDLKDSLSGHMDRLHDLADDKKDSISDRMDAVEESIDAIEFDIDKDKLEDYMDDIRENMEKAEKVIEEMEPLLAQASGDIKKQAEEVIKKFRELKQLVEQLKKIIEGGGIPGVTIPPGTGGGTVPGTGEGAESGNNDSARSDGSEWYLTVSLPDESVDLPEGGEREVHEEDTGEEEDKEDEGGVEKPGDGGESGSGNSPEGGSVPGGDKNAAELARLLAKLERYNDNIKSDIKKITDILDDLPDEMSDLGDDFEEIGDKIEAMTDTIGDMMDEVGDELGGLKDDVESYGDKISGSMDQTTDTIDSDMDAISDQMELIKDKFSDIRVTISDNFDELKSRIEDGSVYVDVSEFASTNPGDGKIVSCKNSGEIHADSQAGGIVGSILKEGTSEVSDWMFEKNDDDEKDDKDSITKHVRALVYDCSNTSEINVQDDHAGGIVGKADYGMMRACQNYGDVISEDGSYVGGIAGESAYSIKDSYVLCGLNGSSYVGGIVGKGEDISGSCVCTYMDMDEYANSVGAVAGRAGGIVENNCFADNGYGAVDGVTKSSEAAGMSYQELLKQQTMPEGFTSFTVRFVDDGDTVFEDTFVYGDPFEIEKYPQLKEPEGQYAYWEEKKISPVHRNVSVHAVYRAYIPSLSAGGSKGHSEVLLGGEFYPDSALSVKELTEEERAQALGDIQEDLSEYNVMKAYSYEIAQSKPLQGEISLHVKKEPAEADSIMLLSDKKISESDILEAETEGNYLVVKTTLDSKGYIIVMDKAVHNDTAVVILVLVIMVMSIIGIFLWRKKYLIFVFPKMKIFYKTQEKVSGTMVPDKEDTENGFTE